MRNHVLSIFSNSVQGRSPTGRLISSGNAPRLFGPEDGRLRGNREDAVIRLSVQYPAAKLRAHLPWGKGAVPADNFLQPLLKEIELLEFTTIFNLMQPTQRNNQARIGIGVGMMTASRA